MMFGLDFWRDRSEGAVGIARYGHWALAIRLPAIRFYRKRRHPSQRTAP